MHRIHPISAETIQPHIGSPVLIVLHDGTEHIGILSRIDGGKLILNDTPAPVPGAQLTSKRSGSKKSRKRQLANTSGFVPPFFPPFGFGGLIALDIALIALLFAIPFAFI